MFHSSGVSGPRGQVLQVCGAVAPRKMLRIVIYVSGSEFLFKSFRQYGPDQRRRGGGGTIISNGQQETVICKDVEVWIILGVVHDVEVERDVFRVRRHRDERTQQTFPSVGIGGQAISGIDMKRAVIARIECTARGPGNGIVAALVLDQPAGGQRAGRCRIEIFLEYRVRPGSPCRVSETQNRQSLIATNVENKIKRRSPNVCRRQLNDEIRDIRCGSTWSNARVARCPLYDGHSGYRR